MQEVKKQIDTERLEISQQCLRDRLQEVVKKEVPRMYTNSTYFNMVVCSWVGLGEWEKVWKVCEGLMGLADFSVYTWIHSFQLVISALSGNKRKTFLQFATKKLLQSPETPKNLFSYPHYRKNINTLLTHLSYWSLHQETIKICDLILDSDPGVYKSPDQGQYLSLLKIRLEYVRYKARALVGLGRVGDALELYDGVGKQFGDFVEVFCGKFGFVYLDLGRKEEALEMVKNKSEYEYFNYHYMVGMTLCQVGQHKSSLIHFKRCLQRCQKQTPLKCLKIHQLLSLAYFNLSQPEQCLSSIQKYFQTIFTMGSLTHSQITQAASLYKINLYTTLPRFRDICLELKKEGEFLEKLEKLVNCGYRVCVGLGALQNATTQKAYIYYLKGDKNKAYDLYSPSSKYYEQMYNSTLLSSQQIQKKNQQDLKTRPLPAGSYYLPSPPRNLQQQATQQVQNAKDYDLIGFKNYLMTHCDGIQLEERIRLYDSHFMKYPQSKPTHLKYQLLMNQLLVKQGKIDDAIDSYLQKINCYIQQNQLQIFLKLSKTYKKIPNHPQSNHYLNIFGHLFLSMSVQSLSDQQESPERSEYFRMVLFLGNLVGSLCEGLGLGKEERGEICRRRLYQILGDLWMFLKGSCGGCDFQGLDLLTGKYKEKLKKLIEFEQQFYVIIQNLTQITKQNNKKELQEINRTYQKLKKSRPALDNEDQIIQKREMGINAEKDKIAVEPRENKPKEQDIMMEVHVDGNQDQLEARIRALQIELNSTKNQNKILKQKLKSISETIKDVQF